MSAAISVVIATYNYGRFLAGAVGSVLTQSFQDFEINIVDDGSTDDTATVAASFLTDPRIRYYRTDRQGQPAAKNTGIRLATAPLIAFLDADDLWLPSKLERQTALFARDPDLAVVYSRRIWMDEDGKDLVHSEPPLYRGEVLEQMFLNNFICFSSAIVRREVFAAVGHFDESIPMAIDFDFWLRAAMRYRFDYVDEPLVKYRTGHMNLSSRGVERGEIATRIMRRFLDERGGRARLDKYVVRRAWAEIYCSIGYTQWPTSRLAACQCYFRALIASPTRLATWKGLIRLAVPESIRRIFRRLFGRPADWSLRRQGGKIG